MGQGGQKLWREKMEIDSTHTCPYETLEDSRPLDTDAKYS